MRIAVSLALAAAAFGWMGAARAQEPINPYQPAEAAPPAPPAVAAPAAPAVVVAPPGPAPTVVVPPPPTVLPPPPTGTVVAQPIDPYGAPLAPGVYVQQPPVYYAPAPGPFRPSCNSYCGCNCCNYGCRPLHLQRRKWDGIRRFSLGVHGGFIMLNQKFGNDQMTLGGAGIHMRLRSAGHWGFEVSQSFLHADYWGGNFSRDSFPFQLSAMFYLFSNRDSHHLNLYAIAGAGLVADDVQLYNERSQLVTQSFTEVELHAGAGAELRFKWFSLDADARYISLWRDSSDAPAAFYGNVGGAPVPPHSQGVQLNVAASIWF